MRFKIKIKPEDGMYKWTIMSVDEVFQLGGQSLFYVRRGVSDSIDQAEHDAERQCHDLAGEILYSRSQHRDYVFDTNKP